MEVLIDRLDHQGRGITTVDGKITFVENALPGEIVDIKIIKSEKKINEAVLEKIIKKSPKRVEPICPYYHECGGCSLMHLSYDDQLLYKENKVVDILKKFGGIEEAKINKIIPSPDVYNYRNKVVLKCNGKLGYYKRKTNDIINIESCYLVSDKLNNIIKKLNENGLDKEVKEVTVRNIIEDDYSLTLSLQNGLNNYDKYKKIVSKLTLLDKNNKEITSNNSKIIGRLGKKEYLVSPTAFFQVNTKQTVNLYDKILEYVKEENPKSLIDLYCGTGTIGIYVSDYTEKLFGVEINKKAIEDAKENARINDVKNATFVAGDTKTILGKNNLKSDMVIVDPPRSGLDKNVISDLFKIGSKKIIYVSCDPITLARDLKILNEKYEVVEVTPFDMFPNTYHVENVVLLKRR